MTMRQHAMTEGKYLGPSGVTHRSCPGMFYLLFILLLLTHFIYIIAIYDDATARHNRGELGKWAQIMCRVIRAQVCLSSIFLLSLYTVKITLYTYIYIYYSSPQRRDGMPQRRGGIEKIGPNDVTRHSGPGMFSSFMFLYTYIL